MDLFASDAEDRNFLNVSTSIPGGSRLQSLFGMNDQMDQSSPSNQSLTYSAPKQPSKNLPKPQPKKDDQKASSNVSFAVAIMAYRYHNGQNMKVGKLGAAILKNVADNDFKILLYLSKQKPVTAAKITSSFLFTLQPNNYVGFYDDKRQFWNLLFDDDQQLTDFTKHVTLSKFFSEKFPHEIATSDLVYLAPNTQDSSTSIGDHLEVRYTGWLVDQNLASLANIFDSNVTKEKAFRFKIGQGKVVKGWDVGLIGMKKGSKRFLILPPLMGYGEKGLPNRIPPNSILAFEVQLIRIKKTKLTLSAASSIESISQLNEVESKPLKSEINIPTSKDLSTSNSMTSSETTQSLVSRMARMGQAMFPVTTPGSDQSTVQQPEKTRSTEDLKVEETPVASVTSSATSSSCVTSSVTSSSFVTSSASNSQIESVATTSLTPRQTSNIDSDAISKLVYESRQQNSEMRIIQEKIGRVSDHVIDLKKDLSESPLLSRSSQVIMDTATLMFNIQRIVEENEKIKTQLRGKSDQIDSQQDRISRLLQQNQDFVEKNSQLMNQINNSMNDPKMQQLESDQKKIKKELSESQQEVEDLMKKLEIAKQRDFNLRERFKTLYEKSEARADAAEELVEGLKSKVNDVTASRSENVKSQEDKISALKTEIEDLKKERCRVEEDSELNMKKLKEDLSKQKNENIKLEEEKNSLKSRIEEVEDLERSLTSAKAEDLKANSESEEQKKEIERLKDVERSFDIYKDHYETLRSRSAEMKMKYVEEIKRLNHLLKRSSAESDQLSFEIKKIMNNVFQQMRNEVDADEEYSGNFILKTTLNIIRRNTFEFLKKDLEEELEEDEDVSSKETDEEQIEKEEEQKSDEKENEEIEFDDQKTVELKVDENTKESCEDETLEVEDLQSVVTKDLPSNSESSENVLEIQKTSSNNSLNISEDVNQFFNDANEQCLLQYLK